MSRLLAYKRVDVAIEAANRLRIPLKIIGDGRDEKRLKEMAGPTVEFLGRLGDRDVVDCLQRSRALVFPGLEDFGIVPVEAMACGKPVIAYGRGGALDTVIDGVTGVFFDEPTAESLGAAISSFDPADYDPHQIRKHAETFDVEVFKRRMRDYIEEKLDQHRGHYNMLNRSGLQEGLATIEHEIAAKPI
jgi:glycosyltransferase involved in cell wall biosynthesis